VHSLRNDFLASIVFELRKSVGKIYFIMTKTKLLQEIKVTRILDLHKLFLIKKKMTMNVKCFRGRISLNRCALTLAQYC
jgi:hypothetical protein